MEQWKPLEDFSGMNPAKLPPELAVQWLKTVQPNPAAGLAVRLLPPRDRLFRKTLHAGDQPVPCPCCGGLLITIRELPGLFPVNDLEVYLPDEREADEDAE